MKNQGLKQLSLEKLTIARIDNASLGRIQGGDCLPTEPTWREHANSDYVCPTSLLP